MITHVSRHAITVFYGIQIYEQRRTYFSSEEIREFPDGVYIHVNGDWFLKDLTPVLLDDVPKELKVMLLLLG